MEAPETLQNAIIYFSDPDRCFQYALNLRWPNGVVSCPRCGSEKHSFIKTRRIWFCAGCKQQFSLKVGTIFEDSPLGLDKWMCAFWMICNCKNGVSSCEIARSLGVTQKSAWFMLHRIRKAMHEDSGLMLSGEVEADETFIGGKARNMHLSKRERRITGTGGKDKTAVMGLLERGGEVRTEVISNRKKALLHAEVKKHVEAGAALYTDALMSYQGLGSDYAHQVVDHAVEYVNGRVHTNGLENYWSLVKRGINGTYVSIEPFHLFRYLDEQSFRYNNRKNMNDQARFEAAMRNVAGKRLTYNELIGLGAATSH
ncbi:MAG: IS1595 family transposase [Terracidiphilus sp.]|jgi:transposase-like protein